MTKTILVVEDNPYMRKAFLEALKVLDFDTLEASNGQEAIQIIQSVCEDGSDVDNQNISLIMSDLSMPEMDGKELFSEARKRCKEIPFVMITGLMINDELDELMASGLSGWLMKPADIEQISQLLTRILG